ncbi:hypothetical protein SPRG_19980 [Saprolegnia parasitica CBS 223.65]|uniref:Cyclin-like domain-containing protein n=1 Tax=Saprolegnia parasitica (strain CBS 223.65) TaxID=695850 RepID=A0A067CPP0_SAPPC|nr:hypothetical protein SPRG_19980 [Saprolegnia parasitica CBS 223.65]KDO28767.1 hypothetical protein SPRG_19980 [Saprolegnia parasitica CBS 223.65]|eukprot:XP_012200512.1 hypothetical protein SPRG_19980 [Saprolegnia parasitica CBS 223.65]
MLEPDAVRRHLRLLLAKEDSPRPSGYLASVQTQGMVASWRKRMVEWMLHTGKAFELSADTVECAIHCMDVYLAALSVDKIVLQLVSMVAMYVASKMHEPRPILMEEMELLCQHKYPRSEIILMEKQLLHVLKWRLNPATPIAFLRDLLTFESVPSIQAHLEEAAMELLEECAIDYEYLVFPSSVVAAAALEVVCATQFGCASPLAAYALDTLGVDAAAFKDCVARMMTLYAPADVEPELATLVYEAKNDVVAEDCKPRSASPTSIDSPGREAVAASPRKKQRATA